MVPVPLLLEPTHFVIRPTVEGLLTRMLPVLLIGVGAGLGEGSGACEYPQLQATNPIRIKPQVRMPSEKG